jgi:hypothetical protein
MMDADQARALAERLHDAEYEEDGTPLLAHIQRVAGKVPTEASTVAWLHEALEWSDVAEEDLLLAGLTSEELRALRLITLSARSQSDSVYLAHLDLIARSAGRSGRLARIVKLADLRDRCAHPRARLTGWTPPYARGLQLLTGMSETQASVA